MRIFAPLGLCASCLIAGCASMFSNAAGTDDVDTAKVDRINRVAQQRGVLVYWASYPQRKPTVVTEPAPASTPGPDGSSMVLSTGT